MFNATSTYKQRLIERIKELIREEGRGVTRQSSAYQRVLDIIEQNDIGSVMSVTKTKE